MATRKNTSSEDNTKHSTIKNNVPKKSTGDITDNDNNDVIKNSRNGTPKNKNKIIKNRFSNNGNRNSIINASINNIKTGNVHNSDMTEYVTKSCGTEPAFDNLYWDEKRPGIYIDINTGEPLFSSTEKFDSNTGWPSFTKPISDAKIEKKEDSTLGMRRVEVRTKASHLGHVFDDGPQGSQRYCINSAALRFIPYQELDNKGYGEYKKLFKFKTATFAAGCFWGVQHLMSTIPGVISTRAGYSGGTTKDPTYEEVCTGKTGHAESVEVIFDPSRISYERLLDYFWRLHDPTQKDKQGPDFGTQYRSAIFYHDNEQKIAAIKSKEMFDAKKVFKYPATTRIENAGPFYEAESYHQFYADNNPGYVCHTFREEVDHGTG